MNDDKNKNIPSKMRSAMERLYSSARKFIAEDLETDISPKELTPTDSRSSPPEIQRVKDAKILDLGDTLTLEAIEAGDVSHLLRLIETKDWKKMKMVGDEELRRELWFQGTLSGRTVLGYEPTLKEREQLQTVKGQSRNMATSTTKVMEVPAGDIVKEYDERIIPSLKASLEEINALKASLGGTHTELGTSDNIFKEPTHLTVSEAMQKARVLFIGERDGASLRVQAYALALLEADHNLDRNYLALSNSLETATKEREQFAALGTSLVRVTRELDGSVMRILPVNEKKVHRELGY